MRKLLLTTTLALPLTMGVTFAQTATTTEPAPAATAEQSAEAAAQNAEAAAENAADAAAATTGAAADAAADAADDAAAAADNAATATTEATAEAAAMEKTVQQQAMNELRLDWLTGAAVNAPDGTKIGDITDIILDADTGMMKAAIIGVGGFLGIGQKQIAVAWDRLTINYDAREITSDLTKEEAEAAQEYEFRSQESAPAAGTATTPAPAATTTETAPAATTTETAPAATTETAPAATTETAPTDGMAGMEGMSGMAPAPSN